jgi:hypothetical protein
MQDFIRQAPNTRGAVIFDGVRLNIKYEIESDAFAVESIHDKIPLLNPEQRAMLEELVEDMLSGKTIEIKIKSKE